MVVKTDEEGYVQDPHLLDEKDRETVRESLLMMYDGLAKNSCALESLRNHDEHRNKQMVELALELVCTLQKNDSELHEYRTTERIGGIALFKAMMDGAFFKVCMENRGENSVEDIVHYCTLNTQVYLDMQREAVGFAMFRYLQKEKPHMELQEVAVRANQFADAVMDLMWAELNR